MRLFNKLLKVVLLCFFLVNELAGCGFHLRGDVEMPPEARQLIVEDLPVGSEIAPVLELQLRRSGIKPLKDPQEAKLILAILGESYKRRVATVSSAGQVQEYELDYTVKYSIKNVDDIQASLMNQSITVTRDLRFNVTEVLGKSTEEARLKQDMIVAAVEQILRRLPNAFEKKL